MNAVNAANTMDSMDFIIRKAIPEDVPGIALTAAEAWHQTYATTLTEKVRLDLLDLFYSPGWLERAIARENSLFETAITASGQIAGFAQWVYAAAPVSACELTRIYIRPACQGQGIGSALLKHGFGNLPEDITLVSLGVKSDNARAMKFYESHGFVFERESRVPIADFMIRLFWFTKRRGVNGWAE